LDVADEGSRHVDDQKADDLVSLARDIAFLRSVLEDRARGLVTAAESDPRLGSRHHPRAGVDFGIGRDGRNIDRRTLRGHAEDYPLLLLAAEDDLTGI